METTLTKIRNLERIYISGYGDDFMDRALDKLPTYFWDRTRTWTCAQFTMTRFVFRNDIQAREKV